jgi:alkyl hydroperoxide reductase subunit AhpC
LTQLRRHEQRLCDLGIDVAVVTFDDGYMAKSYAQLLGKKTKSKWPLLYDANQSLYRDYKMERADWWSIYGPMSIWNYLKLIFRGRRVHRPGKDTWQLGGDILIDPSGIVRLHFVSSTPHDRPSANSIFEVVQSFA